MLRVGLALLVTAALAAGAPAQSLPEGSCSVSVLNQTSFVRADGTWELPNIPSNMGPVRARVTCVSNGRTLSGSSDFFEVRTNRVSGIPKVVLGVAAPTPLRISVSAPAASLTTVGQTVQLAATATFTNGSTANVTSTGTVYTTTDPRVATVSPQGLVTAVASGRVLVTALHEAILGAILIDVSVSGDSDGDGLADDLELANGLNPNDPIDALEDLDADGLTNRQELAEFGTGLRNADSDGDGILDGEEVAAGADGFATNPLLADTDGDGLRDRLEVTTGSDPTDPASYNLAQALQSLQIVPGSFVLTFNTILPEASRQLEVVGRLIDGFELDLTSTARGTSYQSSNLGVCSFGSESGRVFAGTTGSCTVTASNGGRSAQAGGIVRTFAPTALSFLDIPGYANNVDVSGSFAYVAAGAAGLVVVDVSNRNAPVIAGERDTVGNANDVVVEGDRAYVADGASGLQILDVGDPAAPVVLGSVDTPGNAQDVVVRGPLAYVADGASGLHVIDVTDPAAPQILGTVSTGSYARGVDVAQERGLAVVADQSAGVRLVDVSDPALPALLGSVATGDARDVVVQGDTAYVADFSGSFTTVDVTDPAAPAILSRTSLPEGGMLTDVAVVNGFAFGADVFFVNGVPIIDVSAPANALVRTILNFAGFRDDNGTGIAVDGAYVYLTAALDIAENGTSGQTRLYIGQYLDQDVAGEPPSVRITSPTAGSAAIGGTVLSVSVDATDDVTVAVVELLAGGQVVSTDSAAPYQFTLTVPTGAPTLTLGARALDLGGNVGVAADVVIDVIPDPLTTAAGRVVDEEGNPVAGATVTADTGLSGATAADGTFSIAGLPTIQGAISVSASATVAGEVLSGRSDPKEPVPGGVTDFGDVGLRSGAVVGYYDLAWNEGSPAQVAPIEIAGFDAVDVGDLDTADLSRFDILFVQNPNNFWFSPIYTANLAKIFSFVENGGVLILHDRNVSAAASVLPGSPGTIVRDFSHASDIQIVDGSTRVTDGPGGILTDASLDNGNSSSHGYVLSTTIPAGAAGILSTSNPQHLVLYSYGYGRGTVIYSTIPLDYYLAGFGFEALNINMRNYAANVLAWANELR
ncbi:MAG TPA: Ig-like domain-containing protein [Thermoanaerobaculia bacterium]|nr:Ig-like domain-containing protein [Thermoanaerobaculia bacterium]